MLTDSAINSASGRALAACQAVGLKPRYIMNLQGDAPFVSPRHVEQILVKATSNSPDVTTTVVQLDWATLNALCERKNTPFSGTTFIRNSDGRALLFSKNIIPTIRKESHHRGLNELSPIYQLLAVHGDPFVEWTQ